MRVRDISRQAKNRNDESMNRELKERERNRVNVKSFITATKKYTDLRELDATVLRVFIDRINVSAVDKKTKTQEIEIVYNFIGAFDFTTATAQTKSEKSA